MNNRERMADTGRKILRFPLQYRIEHWVFAISFITLGLTGLAQKYFEWPVSVSFIGLLGGIDSVRIIHRIAATVMMVSVVYHIGIVGYRLYVKRYRLSMMPGIDDAKNAVGWFLYNLGFRKEQPQEGRYNYGEKIEYWAVVWGTVIMVITGFMLWNPIATTNILDGQWIPAAKAAHGGEAVLAVLSIILWHFYHVFVRTFNRSMYTGKLTEEQMEEEHPLELADMKAGLHQVKVEPEEKKKRQRRYIPVYSVIGTILLIGIVWFVTFEETAITTIQPTQDVAVFSPLTPTPLPTAAPSPTPQPTSAVEASALDWNTVVGPLLEAQCSACHGGSALGGLDVSTYQSTLAGGNSGPGVVPGEPADSFMVIIQEAGGHPGQLDEADLTTLVNWINAGAPESLDGSSAVVPGETAAVTYVDDVQPLFETACGACHGATALGGLNLLDYESVLAGVDGEPVFEPGDADASSLVELQEAGGHPGQFTDEELELVRAWINAGLPETGADTTSESEAEPAPAAGGELSYSGEISGLFESQCGACHGATALGGLNVLDYEALLAGGASGQAIVPGDPDASSLVELQEAGGHPGQFDDQALAQIREWIAAGAPQ